MSFVFPGWSTAFSPSFYDDARGMLERALNKGNKPPVIQGRIEVVDLNMGTQPPTLTLLEIGDLSLDRFRGILRLGYQGDAWIEVRCRVQANPLSHNPNLIPSSTLPISTPLLASQPLLVPMTLRLSKLHLRAILILVVSKTKGITLVFKNDPLQNVDVSSTFDSVEVIRGYLQQEIEGQLREMFREDLPGIIHRLSQKWFNRSGTGGHVETPYRDMPDSVSLAASTAAGYEEDDEYDPTTATEDIFGPSGVSGSRLSQSQNSQNSTPRRRIHRVASQTLRERATVNLSDSPTSYTVFPDIENYDPTYGLRPEGLPTHSGYEAFGRLWEKARQGSGRGLGSLMEGGATEDAEDSSFDEDVETGEEEDDDEDGSITSGEVILDDDLMSQSTRMHAASMARSHSSPVEWESFPAVGGGMITRPRVFHAQSRIRAPSESGFGQAMPSPGGTAGTATGSVTARASSIGGTSTIGSLRGRPPQSAVGLGVRSPPASPSSLRRTITGGSDTWNNTRTQRSDSLSTYGMHAQQQQQQQYHHHHHSHHRQGSPLRTQSGPGRPRTPVSPGLARTRSNWEHKKRSPDGPDGPPSPARGPPRPVQSHLGARSRAITEPGQSPNAIPPPLPEPRQRTTSFGTTTTSYAPRPRPGGITLQINNSVSQLATLSLSANTLSPYARAHEHIAVRSFPYLGRNTPTSAPGSTTGPLVENGNVKAHRKRIFRLGKNKNSRREPSFSPETDERTPPLDWDEETRQASSSSESMSRAWKYPATRTATTNRAGSRSSYGFPKIPE